MTWWRFPPHAKSFANTKALIETTTIEHNAEESGDTLTSIMLNQTWRKLVASALQFYFKSNADELTLDNEDFLSSLLEDLYTLEETIAMTEKRTLYNHEAPGNDTTVSATFENVVDAGIFHEFEHPNALVRCMNIAAANNTSGQWVYYRITVQDATDVDIAEAALQGTPVRLINTVGIFSNIPTGSPKAINLQFRRSANTGQFFSQSQLVYEIIEWPEPA